MSYKVWTLEDISRGKTDIHGYECKDASFKHAMRAFGWPLNLDHVVTDFSERNPPQSITNEVRDDTFDEWECLKLHIPEQITPSSRRRLIQLVGAKDWRIRREPTNPRSSAAETCSVKDEPISEAEYADKKYRERVEIARRFGQPPPAREQREEERRLDQEALGAFVARSKRKPEAAFNKQEAREAAADARRAMTCGTCVYYSQSGRCNCETSRYKGYQIYSWNTCDFARAGPQAPRRRFEYVKVLAVVMALVFAAGLWNIGERANGYATGQMLYCQDDGRTNCDQRYWEAFRSAVRRNVKEDIEGFAFAGGFLALLLGVSYLLGRTSSTSHDYDGPYDPGL